MLIAVIFWKEHLQVRNRLYFRNKNPNQVHSKITDTEKIRFGGK